VGYRWFFVAPSKSFFRGDARDRAREGVRYDHGSIMVSAMVMVMVVVMAMIEVVPRFAEEQERIMLGTE
jgi:hypothetical protein